MSNTSFNTLELDPETMATATSKVAKILAEEQTNHVTNTLNNTPAGVIHPAPPAPAASPTEPEQKRTRMTVGKLLQKYKDREAEAAAEMAQVEDQLNKLTAQREGLTAQRAFLQGLIAEIEAD